MAAYRLFDGTSAVSITPEYDIKFDARKVENSHRTRSGANYRYRWSTYKHVKATLEYISSSDMCKINSWWGANTPLVLYDLGSVAVISGYLVNASAPIDGLVKPYTNLFKGIIELESY